MKEICVEVPYLPREYPRNIYIMIHDNAKLSREEILSRALMHIDRQEAKELNWKNAQIFD